MLAGMRPQGRSHWEGLDRRGALEAVLSREHFAVGIAILTNEAADSAKLDTLPVEPQERRCRSNHRSLRGSFGRIGWAGSPSTSSARQSRVSRR